VEGGGAGWSLIVGRRPNPLLMASYIPLHPEGNPEEPRSQLAGHWIWFRLAVRMNPHRRCGK